MFQALPNKNLEDNMTTTKKLRNKCFILFEALSVKVYIYLTRPRCPVAIAMFSKINCIEVILFDPKTDPLRAWLPVIKAIMKVINSAPCLPHRSWLPLRCGKTHSLPGRQE